MEHQRPYSVQGNCKVYRTAFTTLGLLEEQIDQTGWVQGEMGAAQACLLTVSQYDCWELCQFRHLRKLRWWYFHCALTIGSQCVELSGLRVIEKLWESQQKSLYSDFALLQPSLGAHVPQIWLWFNQTDHQTYLKWSWWANLRHLVGLYEQLELSEWICVWKAKRQEDFEESRLDWQHRRLLSATRLGVPRHLEDLPVPCPLWRE